MFLSQRLNTNFYVNQLLYFFDNSLNKQFKDYFHFRRLNLNLELSYLNIGKISIWQFVNTIFYHCLFCLYNKLLFIHYKLQDGFQYLGRTLEWNQSDRVYFSLRLSMFVLLSSFRLNFQHGMLSYFTVSRENLGIYAFRYFNPIPAGGGLSSSPPVFLHNSKTIDLMLLKFSDFS